jgi:hypothetical protein
MALNYFGVAIVKAALGRSDCRLLAIRDDDVRIISVDIAVISRCKQIPKYLYGLKHPLSDTSAGNPRHIKHMIHELRPHLSI